MRLVYIRYTVIEIKLVVECFKKRLKCKVQCGVFPDNNFRVTAITFSQARKLLTFSAALCENMVILVDGTCLETLNTELGLALINQSINSVLCVKIIGFYSDE